MWEWRTHVTKVFIIAVFLLPNGVFAAGDHVLISELQTTGGSGATDQDFVELYNPTNQAFDLNGYRLVKRTASGTIDTTIKSWTTSVVIPAHGYFLWANSNFSQPGVTPDETNSGTLSDNNSMALRHGDANTGDIIDSLGWGSATGVFIRGSAFATNPGAKQSLERRPGGGVNTEDTGNNAQDFFLQTNPTPTSGKNTQSETPQADPVAPAKSSAVISVGAVVINEVFPAPSSGQEWVELFNTTAASIDLTGVVIEDGGGPITTLVGTIESNKYFVVALSSSKLNNDGDRVRVVVSGVEIDAVSYGKWNDGNIPDNGAALKANQTLARKANGIDTNNDIQDFAMTEEPTKGQPNIILQREVATVTATPRAQKPVYGAVMKINELVIDPGDGDSEWVEIYNAGETSVDLAGWMLEDGSGTQTKLTGTWMPGQYYIVSSLPGQLNNSGDVLILRDDKGEVHDRVSYGSWDDGNRVDNALTAHDPQSIGRRSDGYDTGVDGKDFVVLTPTKGKSNALGVSGDVITIPDGAVVISEINPGAENAFVELTNTTDSYIRLMGWSIKDGVGEIEKIENILISPQGFSAVRVDDGIDNKKGSIILSDQKNHQKDKVTYRDAVRGKSYALIDSDWQWATPTPDHENKIDVVVAISTTAVGSDVAAPKPVVVVAVTTKPEAKKIAVVKTSVAKVLPVRVLISLELITDKTVGRILRTSGVVSSKQGSIATIKDNDHTLRVSLAAVNYRKENIVVAVGDKVVVTGQVRKSNAGLRIVPRTLAEITVEKPPPLPPKLQPAVEAVVPVEPKRSIPWAVILVALGSILVSLLIKGTISLQKAKEYKRILEDCFIAWRAPK